MKETHHIIGIILIIIGVFDMVLLPKILIPQMEKKHIPEQQIGIIKKAIYLGALICIGLGIMIYYEMIKIPGGF